MKTHYWANTLEFPRQEPIQGLVAGNSSGLAKSQGITSPPLSGIKLEGCYKLCLAYGGGEIGENP